MTTLLQRCQLLEAKIKALALANRGADEQRLVQQRTQEWRDRHERLTVLRSRTASLTLAAADAATIATKRAALRLSAGTVRDRLKESDDDIEALTRDAAWTRLLKTSEGLAEDLEAAGRAAWRAHLDQLGSLEDPTAVGQRAPPTPQNVEALRDYRQAHAAYASLARLTMPRTAEDLAQLAMHVAACRSAFGRITFDLPQDVKRFYEEVHAGTATLAHVTPAVLEWLVEHGYLDRFSVRSAGR